MVAASAIPVPSMLIVVVLEEVEMLEDEVVVLEVVIAASTRLVVELVIDSVPFMTKRGWRR